MKQLIIAVVLLMVAGCSTQVAAPASSSTIVPAGATQAAPTNSQSGAPTLVGALETSGGIAGKMQRFVVWSDGKLELTRGQAQNAVVRVGQATPEQVAQLQTLLSSPEFQALRASYMPKNTCCDRFTYVVSDGTRTVTTLDGENWPKSLATAINMLGTLQAQVPQQ